jgi:hypothetical protein
VKLKFKTASGFLHLSQSDVASSVLGICENGNEFCARNQFVQQFQLFWSQVGSQTAYAGEIAARSIETCDEALLDWVAATKKHDRNPGGCRFCGTSRGSRSSDYHRDSAANQTNRQFRQSIVLALNVFNRYGLEATSLV